MVACCFHESFFRTAESAIDAGTGVSSDQYAAGEQGLGYIYQPRFALLKLLQWPVFVDHFNGLVELASTRIRIESP